METDKRVMVGKGGPGHLCDAEAESRKTGRGKLHGGLFYRDEEDS